MDNYGNAVFTPVDRVEIHKAVIIVLRYLLGEGRRIAAVGMVKSVYEMDLLTAISLVEAISEGNYQIDDHKENGYVYIH